MDPTLEMLTTTQLLLRDYHPLRYCFPTDFEFSSSADVSIPYTTYLLHYCKSFGLPYTAFSLPYSRHLY